ncbi:RidA family protein [Rhodovibrionaceae bacterium A322]
MTAVKSVHSAKVPVPQGHYSQATVANGFLFVSGILGIKAEDKEVTVRSFEEQTLICLDNLREILTAGGSSLQQVAKVTIYVDDVAKWGVANALYAEFFGEHRPARAVVPTGPLHHGFEIEIEAIALVES